MQRIEGIGSQGFLLLAPTPAAEAVRGTILRAGAAPLPEDAYQVLRVEAGVPAPGAELTEDVTPLEAGLRRFCDDHKGCYTGQEIIARQITYDKVTDHLVEVPSCAGDSQSACAVRRLTRAKNRLGQQCGAQRGVGPAGCSGVRAACLQRFGHAGGGWKQRRAGGGGGGRAAVCGVVLVFWRRVYAPQTSEVPEDLGSRFTTVRILMIPTPPLPTYDLRHRIVGVDQLVPLLDGRQVPYVNLDNAASTPA